MADGFYNMVNNVTASLKKEECKTLWYLCTDLLNNICVEDLRGALMAFAKQTQTQVFDSTDKKNQDQVTENSLFHLNTRKNCDEKSCQETDKQEDLNTEINLKDVCHFLDEGFKRKAEEIRRKIEKLCIDIMEECLNFEECRSMDDPPTLSEEKAISPSAQDNIPEPIKTLLQREFSRWESIIIDGVQESLKDIKSSLELSQAEKMQMSLDAVERWVQNCCRYVQRTIDKIQAPASGIKINRLKMITVGVCT